MKNIIEGFMIALMVIGIRVVSVMGFAVGQYKA